MIDKALYELMNDAVEDIAEENSDYVIDNTDDFVFDMQQALYDAVDDILDKFKTKKEQEAKQRKAEKAKMQTAQARILASAIMDFWIATELIDTPRGSSEYAKMALDLTDAILDLLKREYELEENKEDFLSFNYGSDELRNEAAKNLINRMVDGVDDKLEDGKGPAIKLSKVKAKPKNSTVHTESKGTPEWAKDLHNVSEITITPIDLNDLGDAFNDVLESFKGVLKSKE